MKAAQAELEKAFAGIETEKALRLSVENKLSEMKKIHEADLEMALALEQKDRSGFYLCDALTFIYLVGGSNKREGLVSFLPSLLLFPCVPTVRHLGIKSG